MQSWGADQLFYWSVPELSFCILPFISLPFLRNSSQNHHNIDMIQSEFNQYAVCDIVSPLDVRVLRCLCSTTNWLPARPFNSLEILSKCLCTCMRACVHSDSGAFHANEKIIGFIPTAQHLETCIFENRFINYFRIKTDQVTEFRKLNLIIEKWSINLLACPSLLSSYN